MLLMQLRLKDACYVASKSQRTSAGRKAIVDHQEPEVKTGTLGFTDRFLTLFANCQIEHPVALSRDGDGDPVFVRQPTQHFSIEIPKSLTFDLVLKLSWVSTAYAAVEGNMLRACGGKFGVAEHFFSFPVLHKSGIPVNNHLFLPPDAIPAGAGNPPKEYQTLWCHVTSFAGQTLSAARNHSEWLRAIICAVIGRIPSTSIDFLLLIFSE